MQLLASDAKRGIWLDGFEGLWGAVQPDRRLRTVLAAASLAAMLAVLLPATMSAQSKDALFIDKNGNVGIGTQTAGWPLTIQGTGVNSDWLQFTDSTGKQRYHFNFTGSGLNLGETGIKEYRLFVQAGTGNVGIGKPPDANAKLDVDGGIMAKALSVGGNANFLGNVVIGADKPGAKLDANGGWALFRGKSASLPTEAGLVAGSSALYFTDTTHKHSLLGNLTGLAAIEDSANYKALMILGRQTDSGRIVRLWDRVGIGGTNCPDDTSTKEKEAEMKNCTPQAALDVKGDATVSGTVKASGGLVPAYDSGWVSDNRRTNHPTIFEHNLKRLPVLVMLFFSPDGGTTAFPVNLQRTTSSGNPVSTEVTSTHVTLFIYSGDHLHQTWRHDKDWTSYDTGYWRVVAF